jgi:hypothetical protein
LSHVTKIKRNMEFSWPLNMQNWGWGLRVCGWRGWEAGETHEESEEFVGIGVGGCENRLHLQRAC